MKVEDFAGKNSVLVLGTEEFMYPAIAVANQFSKNGYSAKCHATTRSPIMVSTEQDYPLHCRYELRSLYDDNRKTFLYDIGTYDKVFVITDAVDTSAAGISDLCNALVQNQNKDISVIRWCE